MYEKRKVLRPCIYIRSHQYFMNRITEIVNRKASKIEVIDVVGY